MIRVSDRVLTAVQPRNRFGALPGKMVSITLMCASIRPSRVSTEIIVNEVSRDLPLQMNEVDCEKEDRRDEERR